MRSRNAVNLQRRKKPSYFLLFMALLSMLYVGYCIGTMQEINLENVSEKLQNALLHPLPIRYTELTGKSILICALLWLVGCMSYIGSIRNYMPGAEYGTARLAAPKELNRRLRDREMQKNKILSEHLRISMNMDYTKLNNNTLIIGGSGSGKSFRIVKPNSYNCESSYIFCDPKGELLRDIGNYLKAAGWRIRILNLVDMDASDKYNPFDYIRSDEDIVKLITNLIANTTPKGSTSSDPFWEKAEGMYLQAIMLYVWYEFPKQGKNANFRGVMELLNKAEIPENEKELSELDKLMFRLPQNHPALINYKKVRSGAADTVRSIIISANSRLAYLQNEKVLRILDGDDMEIPFIGTGVYENPERKTAVFCIIPDNDKSYNFIVGMFYTQLFQELYFIADNQYKDSRGMLPLHVSVWMDEFANVALPDDFLHILGTCRSRNISCNIIIQNLAQLKIMFREAWETVPGNCDTLVYLGGNEQGTHEYISKLLGRWTIDKRSMGETRGSHGSSSRNYDVLGREILTPDEVRKMDNDMCLVFVKGFDPVYDEKYRTWEKGEYKEAASMGKYVYAKEWDKMYEDGRRDFYIDVSGENGKEQSYRVQVEDYQGIYEESELYEMLETMENGCKRFPDNIRGYIYEDMEVFPVFEKSGRRVKSGKNTLRKHRIVGYCMDDECILADETLLDAIFSEGNRVTEYMQVIM